MHDNHSQTELPVVLDIGFFQAQRDGAARDGAIREQGSQCIPGYATSAPRGTDEDIVWEGPREACQREDVRDAKAEVEQLG